MVKVNGIIRYIVKLFTMEQAAMLENSIWKDLA